MNGQTLVEHVRQAKETEVTRLRSDKALLAATEAQLDTPVVLGVVVDTERTLQGVYDDWSERAVTADARETFREAADTAAQNAERLAAERDGEGIQEGLLETVGYDGTAAAVGGSLVGQSLVFDGVLLQAINFFVNEADERRADILRDVRSDVNSRIDDGALVLDALCETDDDWTQAQTAARDAVEAAYGQYVETLGELGIDPKPVC